MANIIVFEHGRMELGANDSGPSYFIPIGPGEHRVDIIYGIGVTGTVTPKHTANPKNANSMNAVTIEGEDLVLTGTGGFSVLGPCWVGCVVATLSGGTVNVQAV